MNVLIYDAEIKKVISDKMEKRLQEVVDYYESIPHVKLIAQYLENLAREDDRERKEFPSLGRIPKDEKTWIGWVGAAKNLWRLLEEV